MLHFVNAVRVLEKPGDLLHLVTVCTDTTAPSTERYLGGEATNEYAVEVLTELLAAFDAKIQCHGPHAK